MPVALTGHSETAIIVDDSIIMQAIINPHNNTCEKVPV